MRTPAELRSSRVGAARPETSRRAGPPLRVLFQMYVPSHFQAAGTLQSLRVCHYLARAGADVHLHICARSLLSTTELLEYLGLAPIDRLHVTFHRHPLVGTRNDAALKAWGMLFHARRLLTLLLTSERARYDVFLARGFRFPALHAVFKRRLGYKVVFEIHEILYLTRLGTAPDEVLERVRPRIDAERLTFRRADGIISISKSLLAFAESRWGKAARASVVPSGAILFASEPLADGRPIRHVRFVGNLYPFSGTDDLIEAVRRTSAPVTCDIVGGRGPGDENHDRLQRLIEERNLGARVRLAGFVQPSELPAAYAKSDVLVMAYRDYVRYRHFASPLKLFEYMSARRPVIASDLPAIREILTDGVNALLVPPGDPEAIARAIDRLVSDPSLARRLAETAYEDVQRYAMEHKAEAMLRFLEEVVRSR